MSRPAPHIIDQRKDSRWITTAILDPEANYIVCRSGKPIMVRVSNELSTTAHKYLRAVYTKPTHAYARAAKLNELFRTDIYEVYHLVVGEKATHKENAEMNTTMNKLGEAFVTLANKAKDFVEDGAQGMAERMAIRPYLFDYKRRFPSAKFPMHDEVSGRVVFEDATVQADFLAFVADPTSSKKEGK